MQNVIINIDVRGRLIFKTNLANADVMHIPTAMIQRKFINLERLSTSSSSSEDFSGI
jgi:hypothetical protein